MRASGSRTGGCRSSTCHPLRELWAPETFIVTLDQSLVLALEDESRWAMKNGLVGGTKVPNYLNFIYFDGLESVKPKAVRILR